MSTIAVNAITDASGGNTASINGATPTTDNTMGRNRIINGAMEISQRGTSFAGLTNGSNGYTLDRWFWNESGTSTAVQTVAQSTSVPSNGGFTQSLQVTTTTAHSPLAADNTYRVGQSIEGFNVADLMYGTANAKTITLSFWVRSSLTGTFGGVLFNGAFDRFYVYSYTINATDTWEYKTVTIAGDTTGTWATNNTTGLAVEFSMGAGSNYLTTSGSWGSTRVHAPTGQVNVAGTNGATFYITGVQLEAGSVATSFERRQYGQELALCQRYYQNVVLPNGAYFYAISSAQYRRYTVSFLQEMRSAPTCTATGVTGNSSGPTVGNVSTSSTTVAADGASGTTLVSWTSAGNVTASAEL